jgi:hypothetical protein
MPQVKLPTPNPSGSTAVDLIDGPAADLLRLVMNNLPSFISMEPLLSFLKDTFCDAGLGSLAAQGKGPKILSPQTEKGHDKGIV